MQRAQEERSDSESQWARTLLMAPGSAHSPAAGSCLGKGGSSYQCCRAAWEVLRSDSNELL